MKHNVLIMTNRNIFVRLIVAKLMCLTFAVILNAPFHFISPCALCVNLSQPEEGCFFYVTLKLFSLNCCLIN